jgi:ABC-type methionine transport system ATPase subunit
VTSAKERAYEMPGLCYTILLPIPVSYQRGRATMVKRQVMLTFPQEQLKEPIIYNLSHQFKIMTNILRADITDDRGWMILELEGDNEEIEHGITWVTTRGVRVELVS